MQTHQAPALCSLLEIPDLQCDACLVDEQNNLQFISLWGRETAVKELLARITLGKSQNGLNRFHLSLEKSEIPVFIPDAEILKKKMTHTYKQTLFGNLLNVWLFHQDCVTPDKSSHKAVMIYPKEIAENHHAALWLLMKEVSSLPLLDTWQDTVISLLNHHNMITPLKCVIGDVVGWQIHLDESSLESEISTLIQEHRLAIKET